MCHKQGWCFGLDHTASGLLLPELQGRQQTARFSLLLVRAVSIITDSDWHATVAASDEAAESHFWGAFPRVCIQPHQLSA